MYLPNTGVRPTGFEAGEFIEVTSMSDEVEFGARARRAHPEPVPSDPALGQRTGELHGLEQPPRDATVSMSPDTQEGEAR